MQKQERKKNQLSHLQVTSLLPAAPRRAGPGISGMLPAEMLIHGKASHWELTGAAGSTAPCQEAAAGLAAPQCRAYTPSTAAPGSPPHQQPTQGDLQWDARRRQSPVSGMKK